MTKGGREAAQSTTAGVAIIASAFIKNNYYITFHRLIVLQWGLVKRFSASMCSCNNK